MTKVLMERDPDSMTITWENMNAYVPEARKPLLPCFKKAVSDDRRHIIQNGNLIMHIISIMHRNK
jgi:hypothetical protein